MDFVLPKSQKYPKMDRLSVPSVGRTIFSSTLPWVQPISLTFRELTKSIRDQNKQDDLWDRYLTTFSRLTPVFSYDSLPTEIKLNLCISAILCEWMLYHVANPNDNKDITFEEAEDWFIGNDKSNAPGLLIGNNRIKLSLPEELNNLSFRNDFIDLLPYILEYFNNLSSLGEMPDKELLRTKRREAGVIYTPSDVADFIANQAIKPHLTDEHTLFSINPKFGILDPGCGTGVFLRSALSILKDHGNKDTSALDLIKFLYGMDISHQAIQSCAFMLEAQCLNNTTINSLSPWSIWHLIRKNLAVIDSTIVYCDRNQYAFHPNLPTNISNIDGLKLGDIFPEFTAGFPVVIGNPPYSLIPHDSYMGVRAAHFKTAPSSIKGRGSSYYTLFVEMMWQFAHTSPASGGMVIPLSISYSTLASIERLRTAIQEVPGEWQFAFFDRTPDSLFGDDVKTRNAIVLWHRNTNDNPSHIWTGPLIRWSSRSRRNLFSHIPYVSLNISSLRGSIPKLGSTLEVVLYQSIKNTEHSLSTLLNNRRPQNIEGSTSVFYSAVAYNWIPVFKNLPNLIQNEAITTRNSIQTIHCESERESWFVFACLVSRLTYWLWRVEGDGFHVTKDFIARLPFYPSSLKEEKFNQLILSSQEMWNQMLINPVISVNKGKKTVSYYPLACDKQLMLIDSILLNSIGLSDRYIKFFSKFVMDNIVAGRYDEVSTNPALRRLSR